MRLFDFLRKIIIKEHLIVKTSSDQLEGEIKWEPSITYAYIGKLRTGTGTVPVLLIINFLTNPAAATVFFKINFEVTKTSPSLFLLSSSKLQIVHKADARLHRVQLSQQSRAHPRTAAEHAARTPRRMLFVRRRTAGGRSASATVFLIARRKGKHRRWRRLARLCC